MDASAEDRRILAMYERAARDHLALYSTLTAETQHDNWARIGEILADAVETWRDRCRHDPVAATIRRGMAL